MPPDRHVRRCKDFAKSLVKAPTGALTGAGPSRRARLRPVRAAVLLLVAACAPLPGDGPVSRRSGVLSDTLTLPAMKTPAGRAAPAPGRSNGSIAADFLDLSFALENGRQLPVLTRFETPVTIRLTGMTPGAVTERDLDSLLARLRAEAGIDIRRTSPGAPASITVELVPQRVMRRAVPRAACFVAPNVDSWRAYLAPAPRPGWAAMTSREKLAIFIPGDAAPQEIRDCLHEEIAQALGPVNDLYRLTDSVFNDDKFRTVLTGFDTVVRRAYYDPALRSGMSRDAVAARLPAILARVNPAGRSAPTPPRRAPTTRQWIDQIETALGSHRPGPRQLAAAARAVEIARKQGWQDNRLGFSLYAFGRLVLSRDSRAAIAAFAEAERIFRARPDTRLHAAHVAVQAAAFALSSGQAQSAISIADANSPVALAAENASLLSTLLMIKAQALDSLGRRADARIVRLDALGWARYGLGQETAIRKRLGEIAALAPPDRRRAER